MRFVFIFFLTLFFCVSCGNDPDVEIRYAKALERAIEQLDSTENTDGLIRAEELQDSALAIEGVSELERTGLVKDVEQRFDSALEAAQKRVMDKLDQYMSDTTIVKE